MSKICKHAYERLSEYKRTIEMCSYENLSKTFMNRKNYDDAKNLLTSLEQKLTNDYQNLHFIKYNNMKMCWHDALIIEKFSQEGVYFDINRNTLNRICHGLKKLNVNNMKNI